MAQDKKTEEREYLQYFLSSDEGKKWYQQNRIVFCKGGESPDFTFVTEDKMNILIFLSVTLKIWMVNLVARSIMNALARKLFVLSTIFHNL